jgi:GNAT superfamily N-acetyltransferase
MVDVVYSQVTKIPKQLLEGFRSRTHADAQYMRLVGGANVKLLATCGDPAGFICGSRYKYDGSWSGRRIIACFGFSVEPQYQRQGIGTGLLLRMMLYAKREGFDGVSLEKMTGPSEDLVYKLKHRTRKNPWLDIGFTDTETHMCADIWFKKF